MKRHKRRDLVAFSSYESDRLLLGEAIDLLLAFWLEQPRPRKFFWRDLSPTLARYVKLKAAGKVK